MDRNSASYARYVATLKRELVPALGCTEPIAVAYAAAKAVQVLENFPDELWAECSGNIIKNVKSVIVPKTGDLKGIEASAILGALGGDPKKELEVLETVTPQDIAKTRKLLPTGMCRVALLHPLLSAFARHSQERRREALWWKFGTSTPRLCALKKMGSLFLWTRPQKALSPKTRNPR